MSGRYSKKSKQKQLEALVYYMKDNPELLSCLKWESLSKQLNSLGPPIRTVAEWKKTWADLKSRTKKKVISNTKSLQEPAGGLYRFANLSKLEEIIDQIVQLSPDVVNRSKTLAKEGDNAASQSRDDEEMLESLLETPGTSKDIAEATPNSNLENILEDMSIEDFVANKLKAGKYKLVNNDWGISLMWSIYAMVADETGSVLDGYIYCRQCKVMIKYSRNSKKGAYRHKCYVDLKSTNKVNIVKDDDGDETQTDSLLSENDRVSVANKEYVDNLLRISDRRQSVRNMIADTDNKIRDGVYKLRDIHGRRSSVYTCFKEICKEDGSIVEDLLFCSECKKVLVFNAIRDGTSNLTRHKYRCSQVKEGGPPMKIVKRCDQKDENEDTIIFRDSQDNYAEETFSNEGCDELQFDEEEENAGSEMEFLSIIKIEEEQIQENENAYGDSLLFNENDDSKIHCSNLENILEDMSIEDFVANKLKAGKYKLVNNDWGISLMWSIYAMVADETGSVLDGYIYCRQCKVMIKYSRNSKTGAYRHKCYVDLKSTNKVNIVKDDDGDETQTDSLLSENDPVSVADKEYVDNLLRISDRRQSVKNMIADTDKKIRDGVYKLRDIHGRRSSVHTCFKEICKEDGSIVENLLFCSECKKVLVFNAIRDGTSNMTRHKYRCSQVKEGGPPMKIVKRCDQKDENEDTIIFRDSQDNYAEETFSNEGYDELPFDEEEENAGSEMEFLSIIKIEEEQIQVNENAYGDSLLFNENEDSKTHCSKVRQLEEKLETGACSLRRNKNVKSLLWDTYDLILDEDGSIAEEYVCCRKCKKVLKFKNRSTLNPRRHNCYLEALQPPQLKPINEKDKAEAVEVCSQWLLQDCLPPYVVEGKAFLKMLKFFINLGAMYGKCLNIAETIPDKTTLSNHIKSMADEKKCTVRSQLEKMCKNIAVTVDILPNQYLERQHLSVTLHYETNCELSNIHLGIKSISMNNISTEEVVHNKIVQMLEEFGVCSMDHIIFVADSQSVMKNALKHYTTLHCSNSLFSKTIDKAIELTNELIPLFVFCKVILKHYKDHNIDMLNSAMNKIQCKSKYNLIRTITESWQQIQEILLESSIMPKNKINSLGQLVQLCQKFEVIFKKLQSSQSPSLCFVIPSINCIKKFCEGKPSDDPAIMAFKLNILKCLAEIWMPNISLWHKAACFLYPPANKEQLLDLNEIKQFCIEQMMQMDQNSSSTAKGTDSDSDSKGNCNEDLSFFFPTLVRKSLQTVSKSPTEEVSCYCLESVLIDDSFNALQWWQKNASIYPQLSKLALRILSIPASIMATQRSFALLEQLVLEKLNKFTPKTVENILFLNSLNDVK